MLISGPIETGDDEKFIRAVRAENDVGRYRAFVFLNSNGGDLAASLKIGRIIRQLKFGTNLREGSKCYSSCALIYIGGYSRTVYGWDPSSSSSSEISKIGLHRPYLSGAPRGEAPSREEIEGIYSEMTEYLQDMGSGSDLVDIILKTPPQDLYILRGIEIYKIIPTRDPITDEQTAWSEARRHGLTLDEYRDRVQSLDSIDLFERARRKVKEEDLTDYIEDSISAYFWGISIDDYRERDTLAEASCRLTEGEQKIVAQFHKDFTERVLSRGGNPPMLEKPEPPFTEEMTQCRIRMMRGQ